MGWVVDGGGVVEGFMGWMDVWWGGCSEGSNGWWWGGWLEGSWGGCVGGGGMGCWRVHRVGVYITSNQSFTMSKTFISKH